MKQLLAAIILLWASLKHEILALSLIDIGSFHFMDPNQISGSFFTHSFALSADGGTVVGYANPPYSSYQAFRWTENSGIEKQNIGPWSYALDVNGNGSYLTGFASRTMGSETFRRAARWDSASAGDADLVWLGTIDGASNSTAYAISHDGSVIVGDSGNHPGVFGPGRAFRWSQNGIQDLGTLPGGTFSRANSVNNDGSVVVGASYAFEPIISSRAFIWTDQSGMVDLGLPNIQNPQANLGAGATAISFDGTTVVGDWTNGNVTRPFIWTEEGGMTDLGSLDNNQFTQARSVNGDGTVIVGTSEDSFGNKTAFIWNSGLGMQRLDSYLEQLGLNTTDWSFLEATDISADGTTITGNGSFSGDNHAFVITGIPEPSSLSLLLAGGAVLMAGRRKKQD